MKGFKFYSVKNSRVDKYTVVFPDGTSYSMSTEGSVNSPDYSYHYVGKDTGPYLDETLVNYEDLPEGVKRQIQNILEED